MNLIIPSDRPTLNSFYRSFYSLNPIVGSTIDFYSEYALNFLTIGKTDNEKADQFYADQIDTLNLMDHLVLILREYWLVGEAYVYMMLSELNSKWEKITIQNPDYVIVKADVIGNKEHYLRPDEKLRSLVLSKNRTDEQKKVFELLSKKIVDNISNGENILLDPFYLSAFIRRETPYDFRGTSFLNRSLKSLMFYDYLRESGTAQSELDRVMSEIKVGIQYPFELKDPIMKEVIRTRLLQCTNMIISWLQRKIFSPIAKINDFYEYKNGTKTLLVPPIKFDSQNLMLDI